jgi:hypothetical protein
MRTASQKSRVVYLPGADGGLADAFRYEESRKHFGKICLEF